MTSGDSRFVVLLCESDLKAGQTEARCVSVYLQCICEVFLDLSVGSGQVVAHLLHEKARSSPGPGDAHQCSHSVPTVFPQCSHSVPTVFPQCSHSVPTVFPQMFAQSSHRVLTEFCRRRM